MRRGTTPTIVFTLPFNVSEINNVEIYFSQDDELLLTKTMDECVLAGNTITVTLSQQDTLALDELKTEIQVRFMFNDGSVEATGIAKTKIQKILKDGEIYGN